MKKLLWVAALIAFILGSGAGAAIAAGAQKPASGATQAGGTAQGTQTFDHSKVLGERC